MTRLLLLLLVTLVLAAGCAGSKSGGDVGAFPGGEGESEEEIPVLPQVEPYRMAAGDAVNVQFFYYPKYNFSTLVRPDGMVTIPLVGEVEAVGMRPLELEGLIRQTYAEILAEPEVTVMLTQSANQRFFVFGEVGSPGGYPLIGRMTLLDALAQAGDVKHTGRMDSVILMRKSSEGQYLARKVDVEAKVSGRSPEVIYLAPTDIIYVPMSTIAKVDQFVDQFFNKLNPAWRSYILGREVLNAEGRTIIGQ